MTRRSKSSLKLAGRRPGPKAPVAPARQRTKKTRGSQPSVLRVLCSNTIHGDLGNFEEPSYAAGITETAKTLVTDATQSFKGRKVPVVARHVSVKIRKSDILSATDVDHDHIAATPATGKIFRVLMPLPEDTLSKTGSKTVHRDRDGVFQGIRRVRFNFTNTSGQALHLRANTPIAGINRPKNVATRLYYNDVKLVPREGEKVSHKWAINRFADKDGFFGPIIQNFGVATEDTYRAIVLLDFFLSADDIGKASDVTIPADKIMAELSIVAEIPCLMGPQLPKPEVGFTVETVNRPRFFTQNLISPLEAITIDPFFIDAATRKFSPLLARKRIAEATTERFERFNGPRVHAQPTYTFVEASVQPCISTGPVPMGDGKIAIGLFHCDTNQKLKGLVSLVGHEDTESRIAIPSMCISTHQKNGLNVASDGVFIWNRKEGAWLLGDPSRGDDTALYDNDGPLNSVGVHPMADANTPILVWSNATTTRNATDDDRVSYGLFADVAQLLHGAGDIMDAVAPIGDLLFELV